MKLFLICAFVALALFEGQTGSIETPNLPARFNQVREVRTTFLPNNDLGSIRIATWNIHHGGNASDLAAELQADPVDLALLQEVDWNTSRTNRQDVAVEMADCLRMNAAYGIEFEELSQERDGSAFTGQATLTRLPVRSTRVLRFARQSGFWKPRDWIPMSVPFLQRRLGSRIALVSELSFEKNLLAVYNAHLESRSAGPIQDKQIDEILADSRRYPPGTAIVLGGDLNTKYLPSIFLHKLEAAGFHSALGERVERTHTIVMALDWIFAKGPVSLSAGTVRRDLKGSDHYPVYAVLKAEQHRQ